MPGTLEGFYLIGSVALGAFRPDRSDIDFVAVLSGSLDDARLRRLRAINRLRFAIETGRGLGCGHRSWPLGLNGVFVRWGDLARAASEVVPIAFQVASHFDVGTSSEVNPVDWRLLAEQGITVRGPDRHELQVFTDAGELRAWVVDNLHTYWSDWVHAVRARGWWAAKALLRHGAAHGVLGAPRLHATLATGAIISKEQAGEYSRETFAPEWRTLIHEALAYWRGEPATARYRFPMRRRHDAADFVAAVIADASTRF